MKTYIPHCVLCVLAFGLSLATVGQTVNMGKSYINVTKGLNGGTVEPGDTLEIRASFVVRSGTLDSCRYLDAIPGGTSYVAGTLRILTNEGKIYKQFTDTYGDDPGWVNGSTVTIHLGYNTTASPATAFRRGRVANTHKPSIYGSTCSMIASFRVVVTTDLGTIISTGGGTMTYKNGSSAIQTFTFPANVLQVYGNYGICSSTIGTNAIGTESNGTFGSGRPRNRGASANVPTGYSYRFFTTNSPNDYTYGIANNTSTQTNYSTVNTWAKPDLSSPTHRVFQVWDIIGDHTGAASPSAGNPPCDTTTDANGGYMLIINSAYQIDSAFQQTITGLCPNTYYEISCWMRNICSKCGCDSNGKGATATGGPPYYIPTAPGDSSGVYPNVTFEVDGIDYYTTGNILYTGQWVKKGFTFLTGPAQTSFTLKYFNNAPGGGGNDWALDDISVSTCSPNMSYSQRNPLVCDSNVLVLYDTVRSFFNNYIHYKWQRSTDGGVTWKDVTDAGGPAAPFWNGSAWEYVVSYTIPPEATQLGNNGDKYRLVVATTAENLNDAACRFTDPGNSISLEVMDCGIPLEVSLLSFTARRESQHAVCRWSLEEPRPGLQFDIERSPDGINYRTAGTLQASDGTSFIYTDPEPLSGTLAFYRLRVRQKDGMIFYSPVIPLAGGNPSPTLSVLHILPNPFFDILSAELFADAGGFAVISLMDETGMIRFTRTVLLKTGINRLRIQETQALRTGLYILQVHRGNAVSRCRVMKAPW